MPIAASSAIARSPSHVRPRAAPGRNGEPGRAPVWRPKLLGDGVEVIARRKRVANSVDGNRDEPSIVIAVNRVRRPRYIRQREYVAVLRRRAYRRRARGSTVEQD